MAFLSVKYLDHHTVAEVDKLSLKVVTTNVGYNHTATTNYLDER